MKGVSIVLTLFEKIKLLSLIERYQVELIDYEPGEITAKIHSWDEHELLFTSILERLIDEQYIFSVTKENDLFHIHYSKHLLNNRNTVVALLNILSDYNLV